jgi:hypothetical protein
MSDGDPKEREFREIFIFGKSEAERHEDRAKVQARFGGLWRTRRYLDAYFNAARALFDLAQKDGKLDEFALPLLNLQRHTTELILKSLLGMLYDLADGDAAIERAKGNDDSQVWRPSNSARDRRVSDHRLRSLLQDLKLALAGRQHGPVPMVLFELVEVIESVELGDETRIRYETVGSDAGAHRPSFSEELVIPIGAIHQKLERAIDEIFKWSTPGATQSTSLAEALALEGQAQTQEQYSLGLIF